MGGSRAWALTADPAGMANSSVEAFQGLLDAVTWSRIDVGALSGAAKSVTDEVKGYTAAELVGLVPAGDVDRCAVFVRADRSALDFIRAVPDEGEEFGGVDPDEMADRVEALGQPDAWTLVMIGDHDGWSLRVWMFEDFEMVTVLVGEHSNGTRRAGLVLTV